MSVLENLKENIFPVCISEFEIMMEIIEALHNPYYTKNGNASLQKLRIVLLKNESTIEKGLKTALLLKYVKLEENMTYSITKKAEKLVKSKKKDKKNLIALELMSIEAYKNLISEIELKGGEISVLEVENNFIKVMPGISNENLKNVVDSFISFTTFAEILVSNNNSITITAKFREFSGKSSKKDGKSGNKQKSQEKEYKNKNFEYLNAPICISTYRTMIEIIEALNNPYYLKDGKASVQKLRIITMKKESEVKKGLQSAILLNYIWKNDDKTYSINGKGKALIQARQIERKELIGRAILQIEHYKDFLSLTEINGGEATLKEVENTFKITIPGLDGDLIKKTVESFCSYGYFSEMIVPIGNETYLGFKITPRLKEIIEIMRQQENREETGKIISSEISISKALDKLSDINSNPVPVAVCEYNIMMDIIEALHNPYYTKNGNASLQKLRVILMKSEQLITKGLLTGILFNFLNRENDGSYTIKEQGEDLIESRQIEKKELLGEAFITNKLYEGILDYIEKNKGKIKILDLEEKFRKITEEDNFLTLSDVIQSFISFGYFTEVFVPLQVERKPGIKLTPLFKELKEALTKDSQSEQEDTEKGSESLNKTHEVHSGICGACGGGILPSFSICPYCGNLLGNKELSDFRMIYVKRFFAKPLIEMGVSQLRGIYKFLSPNRTTNRNLTKRQLIEYVESNKWMNKDK
ncbi:MAG: hypothetical protein ACTSWY_16260 [Promethearchaeota archaeon]